MDHAEKSHVIWLFYLSHINKPPLVKRGSKNKSYNGFETGLKNQVRDHLTTLLSKLGIKYQSWKIIYIQIFCIEECDTPSVSHAFWQQWLWVWGWILSPLLLTFFFLHKGDCLWLVLGDPAHLHNAHLTQIRSHQSCNLSLIWTIRSVHFKALYKKILCHCPNCFTHDSSDD